MTRQPEPTTDAEPGTPRKPNAIVRRAAFTEEDRRQDLIAEAAYYYAEHRGFEPGHELDDWLTAEGQIDAALALGEIPTMCGGDDAADR